MAILRKPYTLAVYDDILQTDGSFTEERVCIIGSDKMQSQSRALEPNLIRNVNGQNKFSFKMYKKYIDITTGDKVENPFTEWLVSERKIKLLYDDKWYDFVIKDIAENSSNYLYTYSLEDANVQELSKNGFGVTLDAELMNNIGSAEELGEYVMEETDWTVEGSDVAVQTIEEALVYVTLPSTFGSGTNETKIYRLIDQTEDNLDEGVESQEVTGDAKSSLINQTILAFYSSCKNKPRRFQFIYANNGDYGKNNDGSYKISRKDDRTINEKDCQYYIDFDDPENNYSEHNTTYDLYLPTNFQVGGNGLDTAVSTWYRGARYGFSQQVVYVPLLERYCQKFERDTNVDLTSRVLLHKDGSPNGGISLNIDNDNKQIYTKTTPYSGIKLHLDYDAYSTYTVSYTLKVEDGNLIRIGGHNQSFDTWFSVYDSNQQQIEETTSNSYIELKDSPTEIRVIGKYIKKEPTSKDYSPYIFIQPNRGLDTSISFTISDLQVKIQGEYYGYTDTEYVSPTLVQNCITNYNFKSNSGWTATQTTKVASDIKPSTEGVYGRFVDDTFKSIVDDYFDGTYSDTNIYKSYMKLEFKADNQFVLNSGIRDNRSMIKNMPVGEEWVLDYKIVDKNNVDVTSQFGVEIKEFIYNKDSGAYSERSGSIDLTDRAPTEIETAGLSAELTRKIFTVTTNNYTEETFKGKNGTNGTYLQLQIKPPTGHDYTQTVDGEQVLVPAVYYIEHIALYRKSLNDNEEIIVPDYEAENSIAAEEYVNNSMLEHKYNYFNAWHVDSANPKKCTDKGALPLHTTTTLKYDVYKPVYNTGAQKIRSVSIKESNYFNILQSIAETFEQWLVISIERNDDGSIKPDGKKISFKNYRGDNNYTCFRYGVNLKDIQRTYTSKSIVTKLIVKANSNELGKDGFCTIQRAGANPTGENYIYDFQYYQNTGLMDVNSYLTTNYYLDGAKGNDAALWTGEVSTPTGSEQTNINGYFPRLKKINDAILPLNEEIIGLRADLVQEEAKKEVAEAQKEAALSGIEQTRLDFYALTGVYPEDAQSNKITSIDEDSIVVTPQDDWYTEKQLDGNGKPANTKNWSYNVTDNTISIPLSAISNDTQVTPRDIILTQGATEVSKSGGKYRAKSHEWDGLYVDYAYEDGITYLLSYDFEIIEPKENPPTLKNIGCHNASFAENFKITVKGINNSVDMTTDKDENSNTSVCDLSSYNLTSGKFHVSISGKFDEGATENSKPCLYIQPNRGEGTSEIEYVVSNIKLYEVGTNNTAPNYDRPVSVYVKANLVVEGYTSSIERTIEVKGKIPANSNTTILTAQFTVVDMSRSDVQKYIQELITYRQDYNDAENILTDVEPIVTAKQNAIDAKNQLREQYLNWKKQLNKLFFQRYCRFIQEGTWINEEYTDDEKYYADAQSVMYNSCYPQVAYTINVLELSQLPGYELFKFDLGDKTWAIDDEFFGEGYREEVIITELSEMLDDPSKNTIKVQNFKNQFQDLFQKITATVQQTQYNVGSYEKGAAFLEASEQKKSEFITKAINNAQSYLSAGQTVESGPTGITITDDSNKKRQLRLVGGAILFSAEDPDTKETRWRTGLTNEGISADLITAGRLDAGSVQIMNGDDPVFRWDTYGISAYDARWDDSAGVSVIDSIDTTKFVRFDKHGIYGINSETLNEVVDGANWHPSNINQIDEKATFALTWKGLKVTGDNGPNGAPMVARLGKDSTHMFKIGEEDQTPLMSFSNTGVLTVGGWTVSQDGLEKDETVYLRSTPKEETFSDSQGQSQTENIMLRVGDNFRVSKDGELFANAGKIGAMEIGQIASKEDINNIQVGGKNLLLGSQTLSGANIKVGNIERVGTSDFWAINGNNNGMHSESSYKDILQFSNIEVEENSQYTLSFWAKGTDNVILYFDGPDGYIPCSQTKASWGETGESSDGYIVLQLTESYTRYWITWTIGASTSNPKQLRKHVSWGLFGGDYREVQIYGPKLEKGNKATDWTPAPEEQVSANVDNDFSWKFSPTNGMFMWNGPQTQDKELFKINSKGMYIRGAINCDGEAPFIGTIENQSGEKELVIKASNQFGVDKDGVVFCNNIQATGGKIGAFELDEQNFIFCKPIIGVGENATDWNFIIIGPSGLKIGYIVESLGWIDFRHSRWVMSFVQIRSTLSEAAQVSYRPAKVYDKWDQNEDWNKCSARQAIHKLANTDISKNLVEDTNLSSSNTYSPFIT